MIEQKPFFGSWNAENKKYWIETMQAHRDADRLVAGMWYERHPEKGFVGCFFGCAMQTGDDALEKATTAMGLPHWLVYLAEMLYEGLPDTERLDFPVALLKAIPVDADLDVVKHKIAARRLEKLAEDHPQVASVINAVEELHILEAAGEKQTPERWRGPRVRANQAFRSADIPADAWAAGAAEYSALGYVRRSVGSVINGVRAGHEPDATEFVCIRETKVLLEELGA